MVARRHHYVPKCYLNSFAEPKKGRQKPELLSFDAMQGKCIRTSPDDVALQRDFNTINLEGHPPDAFEKAMAEVESEIGPALVNIIEAKSLASAQDREWLLTLIALLYTRNPRFRETIRSIGENLAKRKLEVALSSPETWKTELKKAQADGAIATDAVVDYDTVKQSYKPEDYTLKLTNEAYIVNELQAFEHALAALRERKWMLVEAPEDSPGFVTCDHPVSLAWSEKPPGPQPLGLRTPKTIVFFPLTPRLAIVGALEGENGEATFTDDEVSLANGTTVLNAQRQVYASRGDFRYQIDQGQPACAGSNLVTDERFVRPAKPSLVKS